MGTVNAGFYSSLGLRDIALWLDELIDQQKRYTQVAIADCAGSSSSTISSLRQHRFNREHEMVGRKPEPDLILALGRCIPDPATGAIFADPWRLIRVATGFEDLRPTAGRLTSAEGQLYLPTTQNKGLKALKKAQGNATIEAFAEACGLPPQTMGEILAGRIPTKFECAKIAAYIYPDKDTRKLMELYGYRFEVDAPGSKENGHALKQ